MAEFMPQENNTSMPTIHVISDSVGLTAQAIARAVSVQFGESNPCIETLSKVETAEEVEEFVKAHRALHLEQLGESQMLIFFTVVNRELAYAVRDCVSRYDDVVAVDLLTPALEAVEEVAGISPSHQAGIQHVVDRHYIKRIDAIEFAINHDDGRNPQDLTRADIVLVGASRTSKTPLSIYLSQMGYKVANVPIDTQTDPPSELFQVDKKNLFGLITTPEVLMKVRRKRLGAQLGVAQNYADLEHVYQDIEQSRELMRRLGCIVVHTEDRAIEETAQEILRYYERTHPQSIK